MIGKSGCESEVGIMGFKNKTVIVTGASNGIGRGVAKGYAESGASVVLADLDEREGLLCVEELKVKVMKPCSLKRMYARKLTFNN